MKFHINFLTSAIFQRYKLLVLQTTLNQWANLVSSKIFGVVSNLVDFKDKQICVEANWNFIAAEMLPIKKAAHLIHTHLVDGYSIFNKAILVFQYFTKSGPGRCCSVVDPEWQPAHYCDGSTRQVRLEEVVHGRSLHFEFHGHAWINSCPKP